jgi:hypothetical protein
MLSTAHPGWRSFERNMLDTFFFKAPDIGQPTSVKVSDGDHLSIPSNQGRCVLCNLVHQVTRKGSGWLLGRHPVMHLW